MCSSLAKFPLGGGVRLASFDPCESSHDLALMLDIRREQFRPDIVQLTFVETGSQCAISR